MPVPHPFRHLPRRRRRFRSSRRAPELRRARASHPHRSFDLGSARSPDVVSPVSRGRGSIWLETQDVIVQPNETSRPGGGWVYRVELGSFRRRPRRPISGPRGGRARAGAFDRSRTFDRALRRAPGKLCHRIGAAVESRELERLGIDSPSVVRERTTTPRRGVSFDRAWTRPFGRIPEFAAPRIRDVSRARRRPYRGYSDRVERAERSHGNERRQSGGLSEGVVPAELSQAFPRRKHSKRRRSRPGPTR
jgi:hypothetical protein